MNFLEKAKHFVSVIMPLLIGVSAINFVINWVESPPFTSLTIGGKLLWLVWLALPILLFGLHKVSGGPSIGEKKNEMYQFFFNGLKIVILILLCIGLIGVYAIMTSTDAGPDAIYNAVGLGIAVIWACIFLGYFVWAVYFYNINLGLTEEEWIKIDAAKEAKRNGDYYAQSDLDDEPKYNPYHSETFGLPGGTVRGMIAFTLLFGAIAMLVVSMGMSNELDPSSMFWDQYEFFKTAFLMMIAFYFGSRSLQYLQPSSPTTPLQQSQPMKDPVIAAVDPKPVVPRIEDVIDDQPKVPEATAQTVSTEVIDPMKPSH